MIRVLHFGAKTYPPSHGGVEKIVADLVHENSLIDSYLIADKIDGEFDFAIKKESGFISGFLQLVRVCRDRKIDVAHFHKETSIPYALMLKTLGFKSVLTLHGFGWKVPRWPFFARAGLWLADIASYFFLDRIVFCSRNDYESVKRYIKTNRLICIENGVDVEKNGGPCSSRSGGIYLGRVSPEKNILSFIGLRERVDFSVCGPIDDRDKYFHERLTDAIKRGDINYLGPVKSSDVPALLRKYSFLVNASFSEGLPVAVLEAASQGLFLILSDIPAHRALDFPDCIYVDPESPRYDSIDFSKLQVSKKNSMVVEERFSLSSMKKNYENLYKEVADE